MSNFNQAVDAIKQRIKDECEPRTSLVTCATCLEEYEVRYEGTTRVSAHVCKGKRP